MSEANLQHAGEPGVQPPRTAGALLREARQAQGLHIAALSAAIKVSQKKLEMLEADRIDELPDATFTRALAQTVCRALKIDPAPVLALLPAPAGHRLEQVGEGINAPFRDRPGRREPKDWGVLTSPAVWGPVLIIAGAAVLYFLPGGWLPNLQLPAAAPAASAPAPGASTVSTTVAMSDTAVAPLAAAPSPLAASAGGATLPSADSGAAVSVAAPAPASAALGPAPVTGGATQPAAAAPLAAPASAAATAPAVATKSGLLQLHAKAGSWIEVQDANSKVLLARLVQPGETVGLDGPTPLRVKIGNAGATEVVFRGQPLDLAPRTRDNIARLELK